MSLLARFSYLSVAGIQIRSIILRQKNVLKQINFSQLQSWKDVYIAT